MVQLINPLAAVNEGQQFVDGIFTQRANRQAGSLLASGNSQGAANTLYRSGDLAGGRQIATQAASDATAARTQRTADSARQLQTTMQVVKALKVQRDAGQDLTAALASYRPTFLAIGTNPQEFDQIAAQVAANPAFLDQVEALTAQAMEYELRAGANGDTVAVGLNPLTGQTSSSVAYSAPREAKRVAVGNDFIEVSEDGTVTPLYQGAKAPEYRSVRNSDGTETIVEVGGRPGGVIGGLPAGSGGAPSAGSDVDVLGAIESVIPGVTFNSGLRTPEQNRGAGGADRSYHLRGQAVDIPPQRGKTPEQLKAELRAQGVDVRELINEGDHWHIAWGNSQQAPNFGRGETRQVASATSAGGGARVVAQGENRGLSPAEQRAEDRNSRIQTRQARQDVRQLRKDFEGQEGVKEYETVRSAYNRLQSLTRSGSATDDTAVGFEFMKMLDPTSVVRESEYALVGQSQGIGGQALVALQRLSTGQRLTPELRRNLVDTAGRVFQGRQSRYNELVQQYRGYAEEDGFDPNRVVPLRNEQTPGRRTRANTNTGGIVPFNLSQPQLSAWQQLGRSGGNPSAPLGSVQNPRWVNPQDPRGSYANIRRGEYFYTPDGQRLQKR